MRIKEKWPNVAQDPKRHVRFGGSRLGLLRPWLPEDESLTLKDLGLAPGTRPKIGLNRAADQKFGRGLAGNVFQPRDSFEQMCLKNELGIQIKPEQRMLEAKGGIDFTVFFDSDTTKRRMSGQGHASTIGSVQSWHKQQTVPQASFQTPRFELFGCKKAQPARNPRMKGSVCTHLVLCIRWYRSGRVSCKTLGQEGATAAGSRELELQGHSAQLLNSELLFCCWVARTASRKFLKDFSVFSWFPFGFQKRGSSQRGVYSKFSERYVSFWVGFFSPFFLLDLLDPQR